MLRADLALLNLNLSLTCPASSSTLLRADLAPLDLNLSLTFRLLPVACLLRRLNLNLYLTFDLDLFRLCFSLPRLAASCLRGALLLLICAGLLGCSSGLRCFDLCLLPAPGDTW